MSDEGFVDNTVCKYNLHRLLHTVRKLIRECDDADIDYEPYIDNDPQAIQINVRFIINICIITFPYKLTNSMQ